MKAALSLLAGAVFCLLPAASSHGETAAAPKEVPVGEKPLGIAFSVKMTGPYAQVCDLQIICAFRHKGIGDTYIGAMKDFDEKVGGLLSAVRNRGEFAGELGESFLFAPPAGSIPAKR